MLRLKKNLWTEIESKGNSEDVDFELESEGDAYWFAEAWRRLFQPHMSSLADRLAPIITTHLLQAHLLLQLVGKADRSWDPLSFGRQSFESPPAIANDSALQTLIDAGRDVITWYTNNSQAKADSLIDIWSNSTCPILERLATFAVAISTAWSADKKIEWLLHNDDMYVGGRKNEVFSLLKTSYPHAEQRVRSRLLERVVRGPNTSANDRTHAYETYNLLYWLQQSAPECDLAKAEFESFVARHPEFRPREHPDLDVVFGPASWGWQSPVSGKELVSKAPEGQVEFLLSFEPSDPLGPDRHGLTRAVSEAVSTSYDWGFRLAQTLHDNAVHKDDLWRAIVDGWTGSNLTDVQWKQILEFIEANDRLLSAATREVSRMLEKGFEGSKIGIPDSLIPSAAVIAQKLWTLCVKADEKSREKADDWYFLAINYPGGTLATLSLELIFRAREKCPEDWKTIPSDLRSLLSPMLEGHSFAAELARVILASRVHFLFAVDMNWTIANIMPLFDWSRDSRDALQAWHGYLGAGAWNEALLEYLMPYYERVFPVVHSDFGRSRERFCEHLAWIACVSLKNPIREGWLNRFLQNVGRDERRMWANSVWMALKSMKEPARKFAWDSWIREYWDRRLDGIPLPFDGEEITIMIGWLPYLGSALPEAVERIERSPTPQFGPSSFLYYELSESDAPDCCPEAIATLLLRVLQAGLNPRYDFEQFENVFKRIAPKAPFQTLVAVCDELARLGYPGAVELRKSIGDNLPA